MPSENVGGIHGSSEPIEPIMVMIPPALDWGARLGKKGGDDVHHERTLAGGVQGKRTHPLDPYIKSDQTG